MSPRTNLLAPPTRREVVLVSALLLILIFVTSRSHLKIIQNNAYLFSSNDPSIDNDERELYTNSNGYNAGSSNPAHIIEYPDPRITWSDEADADFPETKMVSHVTGMLLFYFLSYYYFFKFLRRKFLLFLVRFAVAHLAAIVPRWASRTRVIEV